MNDSRLPSKGDLVDYIESQYPRTRTASAQADVVLHCLKSDAYYASDSTVTTTELLNDVDGATRSVLSNLEDEVGLLDKYKPQGNDSFFVHKRLGETYYSPSNVDMEEIRKDVENLLNHCQENSELREFVADQLGCRATVESIRADLVSDDFDELTKKFDKVVKRIKRKTDVDPRAHGYDEMGWRTRPNRYEVTRAIENVSAG